MNLYYISTIIANYFRDYYPSLVKFSRKIQKFLWYIGIAIYNPIADEDTPDFNSNADYKNSRFCFIIKQKKIIDSYWIDFTDYRIYKEYTDKYSKDLYEALIKSRGKGYTFTAKEVADFVHSAMRDANAAELNNFNEKQDILWLILNDRYKESIVN